MAIQNRRGAYADYQPSKMLPGEFAIVRSGDPNASDGRAVHVAFETNVSKRLAAYDEVQPRETGKGLSTNDYTTPEKEKLAGIATGAEVNVQSNWSQTTTTADDYIKNKPTLGTAAAKNVGSANGVAGLDASGKVPSSQLPSYVDDVIEGYYYNGAFYSDASHTTQITGESGKIYVDLSTDTTYRWSGSIYVQISNPIDIDSTLTQQGKAADAKATGDGLSLKLNNPTGGSTGQVLTKTATGEEWATPEAAGKVDTVNNIQPNPTTKNVQTVIELTQAQYDALATKDPNVVYYITDGSVDYPTASTIPYDNTDSGLTANNVQDAIDEVQDEIGNTSMGTTATTLTGAIAEHESDITTLNSKLTTSFIIKRYSTEITAGANNYGVATANALSMSTPSGYTPIGLVGCQVPAKTSLRAITITATGAQGAIWCDNNTGNTITGTAGIDVLYAKSSLI